jgi:hypothetical protein
MSDLLVYKVIRDLLHRSAWIALYLVHLALKTVAALLFLGVAMVAVDPAGLASGRGGRTVTLTQRAMTGLLSASVGALVWGAGTHLKRWHETMNPLYPEMQVLPYLARLRAFSPLQFDETCPGNGSLHDRDMDAG